jgi:hypothetical protein
MLDIRRGALKEIRKHPESSLPGRSSERAKAGNKYLFEAQALRAGGQDQLLAAHDRQVFL